MAEAQISDSELIELVRNDKSAGYASLYKNYAPLLYGFVLRLVKDDIALNILAAAIVEIWKSWETYELKQGTLFTWMINITRGRIADAVNRSTLQPSCTGIEYILLKNATCTQAAMATGKEEHEIRIELRNALKISR